MKILITGGHGYIARNLRRLLINNGHIIISPGHMELDLINVEYEWMKQYFLNQQFDMVIHTAINGGRRNSKDTFENTYLPNIKMFENLAGHTYNHNIPLIIFGSGAEFDRRFSIKNECQDNIHCRWPIDPYGLSKNIISKYSLHNFTNIWILRLFGCFNYDELPDRFIKSAILNIKHNKPIIINQNKFMDFFYIDDIIPIIEHILRNKDRLCYSRLESKFPFNINLTYNKKIDLNGIAEIISRHLNKFNPTINILDSEIGMEYTGCSRVLDDLDFPQIGLNEGIRRTIELV